MSNKVVVFVLAVIVALGGVVEAWGCEPTVPAPAPVAEDGLATLQADPTAAVQDCANAVIGTLDAFAEGAAFDMNVPVPSPMWESVEAACEHGEYRGDGEFSLIQVWEDGSFLFGWEMTGQTFTGSVYGSPSWDEGKWNWHYQAGDVVL